MPRKENDEPKIDCRRLAETCERERIVLFTLRLPKAKRDALMDLAKRGYGMSAQCLIAKAVDQILAAENKR